MLRIESFGYERWSESLGESTTENMSSALDARLPESASKRYLERATELLDGRDEDPTENNYL